MENLKSNIMIKLGLAICFFILSVVDAQAQSKSIQDSEQFLCTHCIKFNMGIKPILCNNLDSLERVLIKQNLSYARSNFIFQGNVLNDTTLIEGSSQTYIHDKKKPFVYYRKNKGLMGIEIEVINGSDAF